MLVSDHGVRVPAHAVDGAAVDRPVGRGAASRVRIVALLIVDDGSERFPNLRHAARAGETYLRCAALMAKSAAAAGHDLTVFTNDAAGVSEGFGRLGVPERTQVQQYAFTSSLPAGTPHRAAHHKLDLLRELAAGADDRIQVLVDLDTIFLRPLRSDELPDTDQLGAYDITDQMKAESAGRYVTDLIRVAGRSFVRPRWFGGEMLAATGGKVAELMAHLAPVEDRYWQARSGLYHCGDETPVSAAINNYREAGGEILDLGRGGTVLRWWTALRPFQQPRLGEALDRAVLHLPADKDFLASVAERPFDRGGVLDAYRHHARRKLGVRRLKRLGLMAVPGSRPAYVASL